MGCRRGCNGDPICTSINIPCIQIAEEASLGCDGLPEGFARLGFKSDGRLAIYAFVDGDCQEFIIPYATGYALNDLSDVVTPSPAINDFLRFNGTNWVNTPLKDLNASNFEDTVAHANFQGADSTVPNNAITELPITHILKNPRGELSLVGTPPNTVVKFTVSVTGSYQFTAGLHMKLTNTTGVTMTNYGLGMITRVNGVGAGRTALVEKQSFADISSGFSNILHLRKGNLTLDLVQGEVVTFFVFFFGFTGSQYITQAGTGGETSITVMQVA